MTEQPAGPLAVLAAWVLMLVAGAVLWAVTIYAVVKAFEAVGW